MISYLSGRIILKKENFIILDVNSVGYKVFLSSKSINKLTENEPNLEVFCRLIVRENLLDLYGFLTFEEMELFKMLEEISGIGPKASLKLASIGSFEKFKQAIFSQDNNFFKGISGIGEKKIQKIILELTGKLKKISKGEIKDDPLERTLNNLGFSKQDVKQALSQVPKEIKEPEERLKQALKILGKQ